MALVFHQPKAATPVIGVSWMKRVNKTSFELCVRLMSMNTEHLLVSLLFLIHHIIQLFRERPHMTSVGRERGQPYQISMPYMDCLLPLLKVNWFNHRSISTQWKFKFTQISAIQYGRMKTRLNLLFNHLLSAQAT